ncbi:hypothetical protein SCP_0604120 [Sparassis crispa]|uniref:Uncharacterized protein n=1 Tax=Sparassis crispa TaxID=139825 RepID=A0A401GQD4_9APHY|nr:hypothetical protein SCP_0604120 [Sparassis crispa]GBE84433.1 hypothetical protein SCP_0604120 [Sparassis crispa]
MHFVHSQPKRKTFYGKWRPPYYQAKTCDEQMFFARGKSVGTMTKRSMADKSRYVQFSGQTTVRILSPPSSSLVTPHVKLSASDENPETKLDALAAYGQNKPRREKVKLPSVLSEEFAGVPFRGFAPTFHSLPMTFRALPP